MADVLTLNADEKDVSKIVAVVRQLVERFQPSEDTASDAAALAAGALQATNNLSDLSNVTTALSSLGIKTTITMVDDADYAILSTDWIIVTNTALTAPRTWTLPAANVVQPWHPIFVFDRAGAITSTNTLTIARAGSDTINNGGTSFVLITAPTGARLFSDHSSKWTLEFLPSGANSILDRIGTTRGAITYRGASAWALLAPGTAAYVLTSNGAGADPSYQAIPASGGLTVLSYAGAVGTGTTYTVTGLGGYKMFIINLRDVSHNSGSSQTFRCAVSGDNGSSFGTAISPTNGSAYTAAQGVSGIFFVTNVDQTNNQSIIIGSTFVASLADTSSRGPINALQFSFAGGNFDNGSIDIYGLK